MATQNNNNNMKKKRIAYLDCPTGIAGDMLLAACIDAGCDLGILTLMLEGLKDIKNEWNIVVKDVRKGHAGMAAKHVTVETDEPKLGHGHSHGGGDGHGHSHGGGDGHGHSHGGQNNNNGKINEYDADIPFTRKYSDVKRMIEEAPTLTKRVKDMSIAVFHCLAKAEAACHGVPIKDVHFHEVGAIDSIIDTVGCVLALNLLGVEEVYCSDLPFTQGRVKTQHGLLSVPAPATMRVLAESNAVFIPSTSLRGELITPTGASLLVGLNAIFSSPPRFIPSIIGNGAGTKEFENVPNCLRLIIGDAIIQEQPNNRNHLVTNTTTTNNNINNTPMQQEDVLLSSMGGGGGGNVFDKKKTIVLLETNIDDMTPQLVSYVNEKLLDHGAVDVWTSQIIMKKGRPGYTLHVLSKEKDVKRLSNIIFMETTTLGIRKSIVERNTLSRDFVQVETKYGTVNVKIGINDDGYITNRHPEYEDCKRLAIKNNVPLKTVMNEAMACFKQMEINDDMSYIKREEQNGDNNNNTIINSTTKEKKTIIKKDKSDTTKNKSTVAMDTNQTEKGKYNKNKNEDLFAKLEKLAQEEKIQERKDQAIAKREEGNEWFKDQKYGMAIQCYTEAMELNPNDVVNVSNRSNAFFAGRFYEESIRDAKICIKMDPTFAKGYYRLAVALNDIQKTNEALVELEKGLQNVKKGKKALVNLKNKFMGSSSSNTNGSTVQQQIEQQRDDEEEEDNNNNNNNNDNMKIIENISTSNNNKKDIEMRMATETTRTTTTTTTTTTTATEETTSVNTAAPPVVKKMSKFKREMLERKKQQQGGGGGGGK